LVVQLVWLKKDLRIHDHRPLLEASRQGPVVCLYVYEPEIYGADEFDPAHLAFINQSLAELDSRLEGLGAHITYRVGSMPEVLEQLSREVKIAAIRAHEETGQRGARLRNRRVRDWAQARAIPVHEYPQNGVVRALETRNGWSEPLRVLRRPCCVSPAIKAGASLFA
jgi:deoxyribodipyrimidine photo-lyase